VVVDEMLAGRLTEAQARRSKFRNVITRAVGVEPHVTADTVSHVLPPGAISRLVISSDGLHGTLHEDQIEDILVNCPDPQRAASELVAAAKDRGASDNISVIVARIETSDDSANAPEAGEPESDSTKGRNGTGGLLGKYANLIAFAVGAILIAVIACLMLPSASVYSKLDAQMAAQPPASSAGPPFDLTSANYAAPESLLGRSVSTSVLLRSGPALIAVDPTAHRVLRVGANSGQVLTSVPDTDGLAATPTRSTYWDADSEGDTYESQTSPPEVRKFGPDGHFLRTIAQGMLTAPAAIAVAPNGDLFIVDNGVLKRLKASAATSSSGEPPTAAPHS
jgi:hypothetical protein